ncbi:hypothetical protein LAZ67_20002107 [Cordylochernes scorpioides]|uniref:Transposase n=1 Tax=Cordylochernes scorpioides TaxID=51811 RepID=A0ABY6LKK5_9ARAC|nr:hypothetical protein LAZ67_20002107 [Cordylochernes scorpioides]
MVELSEVSYYRYCRITVCYLIGRRFDKQSTCPEVQPLLYVVGEAAQDGKTCMMTSEAAGPLRYGQCSRCCLRNVVEADRRVTIDEIMIRLPPGINKTTKHGVEKPEESAPNWAKVTISAGKVMAIGVLLVDYLPPNTTVNAARYCEVLTKLRAAIKRKRPGLLSRKVLLVHDNARPHAARTTQTLLENFKWEIFTHLILTHLSPYSPDLAPSDFYLFSSTQVAPWWQALCE